AAQRAPDRHVAAQSNADGVEEQLTIPLNGIAWVRGNGNRGCSPVPPGLAAPFGVEDQVVRGGKAFDPREERFLVKIEVAAREVTEHGTAIGLAKVGADGEDGLHLAREDGAPRGA